MFERYTEPARRAIFYARAVSIIGGNSAIDSIHLLAGLMWPDWSRAEVLFLLREKFPQYCKGLGWSFLMTTAGHGLPLTDDAKRIFARSAMEADAMCDAWVDTDHLLLGILCEPASPAALQLAMAGITLENARPVVVENRSSRPDYGPIVPLGKTPSPLVWLKSKWCWWNARRNAKRFGQQQHYIRR
jgi:hypothetical protein